MKAMTMLLFGALLLSAAGDVCAEVQQADAQRQTVVVVVGAGGTPQYAAQFAEWAGLWKQACLKSSARFIAVGLDETPALSDRENLQAALTGEVTDTTSALWLVLIGHGTYDGKTARFNLRGPDISADDLAEWIKPINGPVAVINTASSSAPFLKRLSSPGRVVITATKSGFEQNYARLAQYLAGAIIDPQADLDKDGQISLLESFLTASNRLAEFYSSAGRLATEHALIDDNGDGLGTPADWFRGIRPVRRARDDASLDGYRAHQRHLLYSGTEAKMPADLRVKRDQLELEVMSLRDSRQNLSENDYFSKLESLLCQIARIYEQADQHPTPRNTRQSP